MRQKSVKQRKLESETKGIRRDPIEKFAIECDCGCGNPATDCHEICPGGNRGLSMQNPRTLMYLDGIPRNNKPSCHARVQNLPREKQIAMVARAMRRAANRILRRNIVSDEKIAMYLTQAEP